ncbi:MULTISPECIES: methylmalonyl-CoA mutase family protein [unclassified Nocardioides]|uniref:methylmalonyl-CoA mutase family protein n=1 Tax=unclassified Nocardioides TaxID=2615069 RepID=UPI0009EF86B1|nr:MULTISPECIES: methylmalonyl-CoA mutase family protein [unclassified Nocardioides]GAW50842.1 methylmalonyl-CoA mutase [Nocardioides sp. PD653-B2]GAW52781.1 methylmalonyl-CoA mutase [Nocardioides sp. PD653]
MTVEGGLDEPTELEPEQGSLDLASPEDSWTAADWEKQAAAVLRKAKRLGEDDPDDLVWAKLTRTTLDGIDVTPLGTPDLLDDLQTSGRPTRAGDWDIRSQVSTNEDALVDLEGGVTSLWVRGDADLAALLEGVLLDLAPVVLDGQDPAAFLAYAEGRELHPATNLGVPAAEATADVAKAAQRAEVLAFVVDATHVHDKGASDVQELAWSMAAGATYLRTLTGAGLSVDEAAGLVEFRYAVTDEQFPSIAKLRAARRLWARVLETSAAETREMRLHAVTSRPMMSKYDPWVNMLRTTVAAFAAGVGGADSVTVLPFDSPLGRPDAFGRRIARNTSHLLIDEAHVAHVADPAGGSYAVEKLTDDLARAAWGLFGELDDAPDPLQTLDAGIARTVAKREAEIAQRQRPITGLTEFPHLGEELPAREPDPTAPAVRRYGASFEALRDEPPATPVFLATLGTVAQHTARATFATNLFAAGGIALTTEAGDHRVVCVAGTDAAYDEHGAETAAELRSKGAEWVIVAGRPRDWADDSCAMGVDALDFLTRTRLVLSARGTSGIEGEKPT